MVRGGNSARIFTIEMGGGRQVRLSAGCERQSEAQRVVLHFVQSLT